MKVNKELAITTNTEQKILPLTSKQEEVANKIILEGLKPIDAYVAVYPTTSRAAAAVSISRLLKKPSMISALNARSLHVQQLSQVPKHIIVQELKALLERAKEDKNFKYQIEVLDMVNKMMGYYNHDKTVTNIQVTQKLDFNGFDPDDISFIDITPNEGSDK